MKWISISLRSWICLLTYPRNTQTPKNINSFTVYLTLHHTFQGFQTKYHCDRHLKVCKERNGKDAYMSLEEFAKLDSTCDVVPLKKVSDDHDIMAFKT